MPYNLYLTIVTSGSVSDWYLNMNKRQGVGTQLPYLGNKQIRRRWETIITWNHRREIPYSWCLAGMPWNHTRASGSRDVIPPLSFTRLLGNVLLAAGGIFPLEMEYVFLSLLWLELRLKYCTPNSASSNPLLEAYWIPRAWYFQQRIPKFGISVSALKVRPTSVFWGNFSRGYLRISINSLACLEL